MNGFSKATTDAARTLSGNRFGYTWFQWFAGILGSLIIIGSQI